ncbi:MAG: response regulator [Candidatus Promineifilaceae bacterium]
MLIRILIVDDHEVVRRGLALMLRQEPDFKVVGEAADGREAVALAVELQPDIVLLDYKMPRMDGLEAAAQIRNLAATARCLMLSGAPLETAIFDGLDEGIDGFVHKDCSPDELFFAIRSVSRGKVYLGPEITRALLERSRGTGAGDDTYLPSLSAREQEVLQLMATPATYKQIAGRLHIGEETVRTYAKRILSKLEQPNRTQAVLAGLRFGLIQLEEHS